jgi:thiaminase
MALGAYKSTSFSTISTAAEMIAHIQTEAKLHRTFCSEYGISNEELEHGEEDLACVAYTRWVTDVGTREDWYGLQMALMPCLLGYGAIGRRLFDDPKTVRGNMFRYVITLMKMAIRISDGSKIMLLTIILKQ